MTAAMREVMAHFPEWRRVLELRETVRCPECGGQLDVQTNVTTYEPTTATFGTSPRVAFCNGCEFVHEF